MLTIALMTIIGLLLRIGYLYVQAEAQYDAWEVERAIGRCERIVNELKSR